MNNQSIEFVKNNGLTAPQNVSFDEGNLDAFSRVPTSDPANLFSTQLQYDLDPLQMESGNTGSGTAPAHSANDRMATLAASGTGTSYLQSYQYIPYQPGKSQLVFITGVVGSATANIVKDYGYFDADNGLIFRQDGTNGLKFIRRTKTSGLIVDNEYAQADWNHDKLDGTGESGITFDPNKAFILVIRFQFLGMGRVQFGFDINGTIYWAHEVLNANVLSVPYMQTGTLPIQALLTSSSGASGSMKFKCASVISEGGFSTDKGYSFSTGEGTATAASGSDTAILTLRPNTTFNGITNRSLLLIDTVDLLVTGAQPIWWKLCIGATFSADPASYVDVDANYSSFEYGSGGTLSGSGTRIAGGYLSVSGSSKSAVTQAVNLKYPIGLNRAGAVRANGTLTLIAQGVGGNSAMRAIINFTEIR